MVTGLTDRLTNRAANRNVNSVVRAKEDIRQQCRHARQTMDSQQRQYEQQHIDQKILRILTEYPERSIVVYAAMSDECSCDAICETLWKQGEQVYMPKVLAQRTLTWHKVSDARELKQGRYGIRDPITPAVGFPAECLLFVPGLAFTRSGQRLGMGGGFYDQVLADLDQNSLSIGLAWSCQIVESLPMEAHDQSVKKVFTGERSASES